MRKQLVILTTVVFLFSTLQSPVALGAAQNSSAYYLKQSQIEFEKGNISTALFYLETSFLSDPANKEIFNYLKIVPIRAEYKSSYQAYIKSAHEAFEAGQLMNARFYCKVAYELNPDNEELKSFLDEIEALLDRKNDMVQNRRMAKKPPVVREKKIESTVPEIAGEQKKVSPPALKKEFKPEVEKKKAKPLMPKMAYVQGEPIYSQPNAIRDQYRKKILAAMKKGADIDQLRSLEITDAQTRASSEIPRLIEKKAPEPEPLAQKQEPLPKRSRTVDFDIQAKVEPKDEDLQKSQVPGESSLKRGIKIIEEPAEIKQDEKPRVPPPYTPIINKTAKEVIVKDKIDLDDELWSKQPGTTLEIEYGTSIILRGSNIKRYLVFKEDFIIVERIDQDTLKITSTRRGDVIFHLWDDKGRWTFNIRGVVPISPSSLRAKEDQNRRQVSESPFEFAYSNNWDAFYIGDNIDTLERSSLSYRQWMGLFGQTPYGKFDASVSFFRFEGDDLQVVGQGVGLTNGRIGPFKDFTIRGWDTNRRFSTLSLPGRSFRGFLIDAYAFHRKLKYTYLRGQDRAVFLQISPGVSEVRKSYIEGMRTTLFPDEDHQYSLNFARGFGEERAEDLKDRVVSIDTRHKFDNWDILTELAYDEQDLARIVHTKYRGDDFTLRLNLRDIDEDFTTITGRPSGRGEVGGYVDYDWRGEKTYFGANMDVYHDREIPNPDKPHGVNFDLGLSTGYTINDSTSISASTYYLDTSQLISPQNSFRYSTTLSKSFKILENRALSTHVTMLFQSNRFDNNPGSEFDRYSVNTGFRLPLIRNLYYFMNYEYARVDAIEEDRSTHPKVMNAGLSYSTRITTKLSGNFNISYRDEEEADDDFSFLSGSDTLRFNFGLSYRPVNDVEIFVDGGLRNIWAEDNSKASFNDADLRFGMRSTWDLIFAWNPLAKIEGVVYKDLDRNGLMNGQDAGIEGITVLVGDKEVVTDKKGFYKARVRAKKLKVGLDTSTIPGGHIPSTKTEREFDVVHRETTKINFGLFSKTSITGVVFHDENGNGEFDAGEEFFTGSKVRLDKRLTSVSDFDGIYEFRDIKAGEHTLLIDVNSLPAGYLPVKKIKETVVVKEGESYKWNVPLRRK